MTRWNGVLLLLGICAIGFTRIVLQLRSLKNVIDRDSEFLDKLRSYVESNGASEADYSWLLLNSVTVQNDLMSLGIIARFRPPYENVMYSNWPVILNGVPEMRRWLQIGGELYRPSEQFFHFANLIRECIMRHIGELDARHKEQASALKNPLNWFRYGFQLIVLSPVLLLGWLGFPGIPSLGRLSRNVFANGISAIMALLSLIATLETILSGQSKAFAFLREYVSRWFK